MEGLTDRPVVGAMPIAEIVDVLRRFLGGPLNDQPHDPAGVIEQLAQGCAQGLVASNGPRYFGFVTGGTLPAALAADWLTAAWDQNVALGVMSPAAAVVEAIVGEWLAELLGIPPTASFGLVTGAQMANVVGLAAARRAVLRREGIDVEEVGLAGAPPLRVVAGEQRHVTVDVALRYLGIGRRQLAVVAADDQGRMRAHALAEVLDRLGPGPTVVCAQAGCVDTGAFDPLDEICAVAHQPDRWAWVHVDGAFGLWAAASPQRRHLVAGVGSADSWATDGHKWLNVPYDAGLVFTAHPDDHRGAMSMQAAYLTRDGSGLRDGSDWAPESSRRARAFTVWAALRTLGREGLAELVERTCSLAERAATAFAAEPGIEILNDVVANQVLIRFGADDLTTRDVVAAVQRSGEAWFGFTTWHGKAAARLSVSGWSTGPEDVDRTVAATIAGYRQRLDGRAGPSALG
ncbi:MAG: hypothetical protein QOJ19_3757 [Acidimicrobiia bacterium]|nr:hypothetical protein [Acidimicrobiia bacterium]